MRERGASTATEVVDELVAECYGGWSADVEWLWSRLRKGENHESRGDRALDSKIPSDR
jgi:hypothetical protein